MRAGPTAGLGSGVEEKWQEVRSASTLLPSWLWKQFVPVFVCTQIKASLNYSGAL